MFYPFRFGFERKNNSGQKKITIWKDKIIDVYLYMSVEINLKEKQNEPFSSRKLIRSVFIETFINAEF